jgi:hypothetical protein
VSVLTTKFKKGLAYLSDVFPDYTLIFMLWSPVIKSRRAGSKDNQMRDVIKIANVLKSECQIEIELIVNRKFQEALEGLRAVARGTTYVMASPVMRYLQIEESLASYLLGGNAADHYIPFATSRSLNF